jgi:Tfp pilus assembly ATPase PilU
MFEQPNVARYASTAQGTRLTVEALPNAPASVVADYLIATALPAVLWMLGDLVLHASAATLSGCAGAIAFAGASGSGKSTVLRSLLEHGAGVVAEDSLCVRDGNPMIEVSGLPASILLRQPNAALDADREVFRVPHAEQVASASLGAVVVLGNSPSAKATLRRLSSASALEALLQHRHRATVSHLLGLDAVQLPRFAALARRVPVYLWNRSVPGQPLTGDEVQALRELPDETH